LKKEIFSLYFSSFFKKMEILVLRIRFGILLNLLMEPDQQFLDSETIDRPSFSPDRDSKGF